MDYLDILPLKDCTCHEPSKNAPDGSFLQLRIKKEDPSPSIGMKVSMKSEKSQVTPLFLQLDSANFANILPSALLNRVSALDISGQVELCVKIPAVDEPTHPLQKGDVALASDGAMFIYAETRDEIAWVCVKASDNFEIGSVHDALRDQYKFVGKGTLRRKSSE